MPGLSELIPMHPHGLLSELPRTGGYFDILKIVVFTLAAFLVWQNAAWVNKDTAKIHSPRGPWNAAVLGTGTLCLIVWMLVPLFWVGFAIFTVAYGAAIISYCVYHNGRVAPAQTVLTPAHFRRILSSKPQTNDAIHARDRVRIKDAEGKTPPWPTDSEQHAGYQAMQDLLFDTIWRRASDVWLDLIPSEQVKVVYRVDGVERAHDPIEPDTGAVIFHHMKRVSGMDPEEHRRPQRGHFTAKIGAGGAADKTVDVEIKSSGSTAGQRIAFKLFSEEAKFRLSDIGLTERQMKAFEPALQQSKGVIICSGPRGSGVTSTLYALLRAHDAFIQNINTLETSKALDLENITQNLFDAKSGDVTFAKRFQSMLRTDPDVAMASDTPDADTAQLAATYGRQGKRIYLGMAAKDTFNALRQYLYFLDDPALCASSLTAITNQRLLRKLCESCRKAYRPDPALLKKGNLPTGENRPFFRPPNPNEVEVDKQGNPIICEVCQGSGYLGRTGVFEILIVDKALRSQIAAGAPLPALKAEARKRGLLYLQEVALHRVYDGITSINEVLRVTKESKPRAASAAAK